MKAPLFAAAALASALTLTGCGGTATTTTSAPAATSAPMSAPASTPPPTAKAPAADQTIDGTTLVTKMTDAMMKAGSGTMSTEMAGAAGTTASASPQQVSSKAKFSVSGSTMNVQATMGVAGQQMEIISVDGVMYLKSPLFAGSGKPWVKVDPNGTDAFSKQMAPTLKQSADLRASLEVYKGSTATLVDTSNGLRHYRLSNVMLTVAPSAPPVSQNVDLWLDDQDRPAKMTMISSGVTIQVTYSDWGAPVTITAPPADQVGTLKMPGA